MILELAIGLLIMCTKNNSRPKEVANGTLGNVIGYQLPKTTTTHHQVIDESSRYTVLISPTLPKIIFIKLLGHDQILDPKLLPSIVGIHPILERDVFIELPNRSFIVSIEQIPIVLAFVFTINKCQGLTLSRAILRPLLHPSR
jgi:ATP-dependent exoDNAse (exonuclease V) alpha subunit